MSRLMPALSDGRTFTSYLSAGQREEMLQRKLGATNENEYRRILQHDAKRVEGMLSTTLIVSAPSLPGPKPLRSGK